MTRACNSTAAVVYFNVVLTLAVLGKVFYISLRAWCNVFILCVHAVSLRLEYINSLILDKCAHSTAASNLVSQINFILKF
jgi:hypothetical protein